jgi:hypothetical protein
LIRDIRFDGKAHGFVGSNKLAEFTLSLDNSNQVTWASLANGDRQSEIGIVVANFSEDGKRVGHEVVQFELTRDEIHLPITGDGPFVHSETVILPERVSSVRLVVLDATTGRLGVSDFSLKEILDAPRSPLVIR